MQELNHDERKEWAREKYIYLEQNMDVIAAACSVDVATLVAWIEEGQWDGMRSSLAVSKKKQLKQYFYYLEVLSDPEKLAESGLDLKNLDLITKVTGNINKLEREDSVCHLMEAGLQFTNWLLVRDVDFSQKVTTHFNAFVKQKLAE